MATRYDDVEGLVIGEEDAIDMERLREMARFGLPPEARAAVWKCLLSDDVRESQQDDRNKRKQWTKLMRRIDDSLGSSWALSSSSSSSRPDSEPLSSSSSSSETSSAVSTNASSSNNLAPSSSSSSTTSTSSTSSSTVSQGPLPATGPSRRKNPKAFGTVEQMLQRIRLQIQRIARRLSTHFVSYLLDHGSSSPVLPRNTKDLIQREDSTNQAQEQVEQAQESTGTRKKRKVETDTSLREMEMVLNRVEKVVLGHLILNLDISYEPGIVSLALPIVAVIPEDHEAFDCLQSLQSLMSLALEQQPHTESQFLTLFRAIHPDLHSYFDEEEIHPRDWVSSWLKWLLSKELPLYCLTRLWDTYFADGLGLHIYVCLAIVGEWRDELTELEDVELKGFLQHLPSMDMNKIIRLAYNIQAEALARGLV